MTVAVSTRHFTGTARVGPRTAVVLCGELDIAAADSLARLVRTIDLADVGQLTLDLGGLTFIDAIGLRAVFSVRDLCREHAVAFTVTPGPRAVQRVFQLTHTDVLLPFEPVDR